MESASSLTRELRAVAGIRVWVNAPLAPFTTIGTGGNAGLLVSALTSQGLEATLDLVERAGLPWTCLGAGSNLLVADRGYPGIIVRLDDSFHYVEGIPDGMSTERLAAGAIVTLTVGGGTSLARLATVAGEAGFSGLEFAGGIPGSMGGGVAMNAGAHGRSLSDLVQEVELVAASGTRRQPAAGLEWGYRHCGIPVGAMVTAVRLSLAAGDRETILQRHRSLLRARRTTQPRGVRTFGSTFKNPPGDAAGRLLEVAGLKGVRRGGAEVSSVHANFVVNLGDATTTDVLALMSLMRQAVHRTSGILLEPEVKLLGSVFPWEVAAAGPEELPDRDG